MNRRTLLAAAGIGVLTFTGLVITDESDVLEATVIDAELSSTLVFLPDLHIHRREKRLLDVLTMVREIRPEIVVLGGDLVDRFTVDENFVVEFVSQLPGDERYFVMGNHEYWSGKSGWVRRILAKQGYTEITDVVESPKAGKLYGFDWVENRIYPHRNVSGLVFVHDPIAADFVEGHCLIFAGHTHGGVVLANTVLFTNSKYTRGWYRFGGKSLYVSRGLGHIFPYRPFSKLELVVVV